MCVWIDVFLALPRHLQLARGDTDAEKRGKRRKRGERDTPFYTHRGKAVK
jgi:hypothetical protein